MKNILKAATLSFFCGAVYTLSAASVCPTTPYTTAGSECSYLITIGGNGSATVSTIAGATAFNGPITFTDGTSDPGDNASLIGVVNNSTMSLSSFTLTGAGANAGIFDFSYNGICAYTNSAYCMTASTGYEGPTTTFSNLQSTVLFETTEGTVTFNPTLAAGGSTFFAIEDTATDINANGGLSVSNVTFSSVPEPAAYLLLAAGLGVVGLLRRKITS